MKKIGDNENVHTFIIVVNNRSYEPIASESKIILNNSGKRKFNFKFIQARNCETSFSNLKIRKINKSYGDDNNEDRNKSTNK